jgi:hypothetical protein
LRRALSSYHQCESKRREIRRGKAEKQNKKKNGARHGQHLFAPFASGTEYLASDFLAAFISSIMQPPP